MHDGTRDVTLQVLGEWLARLGSIPADAKAALLKGIVQPAKGLSEQYLGCLFRACDSMDVRQGLADFVAPLVGIVKGSTATQVRRVEGAGGRAGAGCDSDCRVWFGDDGRGGGGLACSWRLSLLLLLWLLLVVVPVGKQRCW